jgi:hypothetical protein
LLKSVKDLTQENNSDEHTRLSKGFFEGD